MKTLVLAFSLVVLAGCAQQVQEAENAWHVVTGATITPTQVYVAANAFDGIEATATTYLRLPKCGTLPCRNPSATAVIVPAIRSGRLARNKLEAAVTVNPGAPVDANLFSTLTTSTDTIKAILNQYNIQ